MRLIIQKTNGLQQESGPEIANIAEMLYPEMNEDTLFSEEIGRMNVIENDEDYRVEIFIPGFRKSDITIKRYEDATVCVSAEAGREFPEEASADLAEEFGHSIYTCSFRLPDNTDTMELEAYYEDGVLTILAPKMEEEDLD